MLDLYKFNYIALLLIATLLVSQPVLCMDMTGKTSKDTANRLLIVAAKTGNMADIEHALVSGTDIDDADQSGDTPLRHAAYYNHKEVVLSYCLSLHCMQSITLPFDAVN